MGTQDDADIINEAMQETIPEVTAPHNDGVPLIRGLRQEVDGEYKWHTTAVVRELTGADEEYLAGVSNRKDVTYSEYMTAILASAVISIGDIEIDKRASLIDKLILADRDVLYLAIVRSTYGRYRKFSATCPSCKEKNEVSIDLENEFDFIEPTFDVRHGLEVETSKGTITLRLPIGDDTNAIAKFSGNEAALNTLMLSRCAVFPDGEEPTNKEEWARGLNIADRRALTQALLDLEIGPQIGEVDARCAYCEKDLPISMDWVSLLLG
jgi:hypothetical protein